MNEKKLEKLLIRLLQAQDDIGYSARAIDIDRVKVNDLFNKREDIRNTILSEFAALRQQRDGLVEALREIALTKPGSLCFQSNCSIDNPICGSMIARATLASIEEAEKEEDNVGLHQK